MGRLFSNYDVDSQNDGLPAIAVDIKLDYQEINTGEIQQQLNCTAPYESDWTIAIGKF